MKVSTTAFVAMIVATLTAALCPKTIEAAGHVLSVQESTLCDPAEDIGTYNDGSDNCTGCNKCDEDWHACGPTWSFRADGLVLFRNPADNRQLVNTSPAGRELLNTSDLRFETEPGFRLGLSRRLSCNWDLEMVYFQADDFDATNTVFHPGLLTFQAPNFIAVADGAVAGMNFTYNSRLYNTEINLKRHVGPAVVLMGGFRWIELSEEFSGSFVTATAKDAFWITDVNNHMYGFQVGAEVKIWDRGGPLTVLGTGKAGIYSHHVDQTSESPRIDEALVASKSHAAFVGELGMMAVYQVSRHVVLRAGYEMLWLNSIALAPEQIDSTDFGSGVAAVNTGGDALYHGLISGVEVSW